MKRLLVVCLVVSALLAPGCGSTPTKIQYTLTIDKQGEGTVSPASGSKFPAGTLVNLTANAAPGWGFGHWGGVDGASVVNDKIIMNKGQRITAVFVSTSTQYTLTITTQGQGTIDPASGSKYAAGTSVNLVPTPANGWVFSGWQGPDASSVVNNRIIMDKDRSLVAVFSQPSCPFVDLVAVPRSGGVPLAVTLTANAIGLGDGLSYAWDFGDGTSHHGQVSTITHTYLYAANYTASVVVTNQSGTKASNSVGIVASQINLPPNVSLSATPTTGSASLAVTFVASATEPDGDFLSYTWDFGDGSRKSGRDTETHTYTKAGPYTATVTVSDGRGGLVSRSIAVAVWGTMGSTTLGGVKQARKVYVSGDYAYVGDNNGSIHVVDVSSPYDPRYATSVSLDTINMDVCVYVVGNRAYACSNGLYVVDVSSPQVPGVLGYVASANNDLSVAGNYAYALSSAGILQVIDVSNPSNPTIIGSLPAQPYAYDAFVSGSYAYTVGARAPYDGSLQIVYIPNMVSQTAEGSLGFGRPERIHVNGNYAYVLDNTVYSTLHVVDVSTPSSPRLIGSLGGFETRTEPGTGLFVRDGYAFITHPNLGLRVIDISNPASPSETLRVDTPGYANDIYVVGHYAYVADSESGLQILYVP